MIKIRSTILQFVKENTYALETFQILDKETIGVVPGEENVLDDISNSLLFESQVLCTNNRWIDQVETKRISSKLVDNLYKFE